MKKTLISLALATSGLFYSQLALADLALSTAKNCMTCHTVDKKVVGPSFKDIAAKYAGQKDAVAKLQIKVTKGGGGVWGGFMPANPQVSEAEAKTLVTWILALK